MTKKNRRLIVESNFIKEGLKNKLSLPEFLLLVYFDNSFDLLFDVNLIEEVLQMKEEDILEAYSSLIAKKIIKVENIKNEAGKICEKVSLEPFYQNIMLQDRNTQKKGLKDDIFSIFEAELGRTLSPMDYELINAWIDKGFSKELIIAALKEATYNGAKNLRYIERVLYEWHKKGFTKPEDVNKNWRDNDGDIPLFETKVMDFDWLNESN